MPLMEEECVPSAYQLLPRVLHDFAQPFTALECSLELALRQDASVDLYRKTLEETLAATHSMSEQLLHFRDLSGALEHNGSFQLTTPSDAVASAVHQIEDLAASLETRIAFHLEPVFLNLNPEKLQFAVVRLLDWLLQTGLPARVSFRSKETLLGELQLSMATPRRRSPSPRPLESARAALSVMGAGLDVFELQDEVQATISLSSHCDADVVNSASDRVF